MGQSHYADSVLADRGFKPVEVFMSLRFRLKRRQQFQAVVAITHEHPEHQIRAIVPCNHLFDTELQSRPLAPWAHCVEGAEPALTLQI